MWLFNIFKNKSKVKKIPSRTLDELKNITKILFVDDKAFKVIDNIKEKNRSQKLKYGLCLREKQIPL